MSEFNNSPLDPSVSPGSAMPSFGKKSAPGNKIIKTIVVIVVIAVAVVLAAYAFYYFGGQNVNNPSANQTISDAEKQQILNSLASQASATPPMSDEQKTDILQSLKQNTPAPTLSDAEKQKILDSLKK